MTTTTQSTPEAEKRGERVAIIGLLLQITATLCLLVLALYTNSLARPGGSSAAWVEVSHLAAGIGVWLVLLLLFNQRKRLRRETLETEALRHEREMSGTHGALFDVDDQELMLSRRRLAWMHRWLLPGYTIALAIKLFSMSLLGQGPLWRSVSDDDLWPAVSGAGVAMWFTGGLALVLFLFSRYATGMARRPEWRALRAGASFTLGNTLIILLLAVAMGASASDQPVPERVLMYIVRGLMLLLALELVFNFMLDLYRPRTAGEESQPAFDSRLLGLLSEPGAIAHSIAEAVNYQFGFEVSSTWFYKLMQRAIVPLIAFGAIVLIALSSVVVIEPHQEALVERWGDPIRVPGPDRRIKALPPGLHFKLPWPIDRVYRHPVKEVQVITLGLDVHEDDVHADGVRPEVVLWSDQEHWGSEHEELNLLVAAPEAEADRTALGESADASGRPVPVSIIQAVVPIYYTISDLGKFVYGFSDARELLESIGYEELTRLASSLDLQEIMGTRRAEAMRTLQRRLNERVGPAGLDMGVTISFVGLDGIHPPHEVAEAFQGVISAQVGMETFKLKAEAGAIRTLVGVAGNQVAAQRLYQAILESEKEGGSDEEAVAILYGRQAGVGPIGGEAAEHIAQARAKRWLTESAAQGDVAQFTLELPAYQMGGELYQKMRAMTVLAKALAKAKKYIIAVDPSKAPEIRWVDQPSSANVLDFSEDEE